MSLFTTREIAIGFWIIVLFIALLIRKDTRDGIIEFIKFIFSKHLRLIWESFFIYVGVITFGVSHIALWKYVYLKDIIIWSLTSGVIVCMNSVDREAKDDYVQKVLKDSIKPMIFVEFIMSTFTFNIIVELIMIPFITALSLAEVLSEGKVEPASAKKFLNGLMGIIGIWILYGTISIAIDEYQQLNYSDTFISFMIPIVYLIAIIPLLFVWLYIGKYDLIFCRMSKYEKNISFKRKIWKRIMVLRLCGLSCDKINRFTRGFSYQSCTSMTEEDFNDILVIFKNDSNNDTWYMKNASCE